MYLARSIFESIISLMSKIKTIKSSATQVFTNLKRLLALSWKTDKFITLGYYGTAGLSSFFPIIASYIYKLFIDELIVSLNVKVGIPLILVALLASRYIVDLTWNFVSWALKNTYFDFLFRYKIQNALNYQFFDKLSKVDIAHLENTKTQDLITKARDTLTWRPPDFLRNFSYFFNNLISYVTSFLVLIYFGFWIPMVVTLVTIPRLYLRARFGRLQWSFYGSGAPEVRRLWYFQWLLYDKTSILESRILQSQSTFLKKFKKIQEYLFDLNKKPVKDYLKVAFYPGILEGGVVLVFALFKLPRVLDGSMSVGDFTFFISLLDRIANSASDLILNFGDMYENNLYVNHYFEVLTLPKLVKELKKATKIKTDAIPKVEFKNVSFSYPDTPDLVLKNVSFTMEPSENIAIVGPNGAGKTTIVKLLCRFYDVTEGEILIDGVNIKDVSLSEWYKFLGTLFQEFMHYNFTVRENIMMGRPELTDKKLMIDAAEKSGAAEFIRKLPKKYNQILGRQFEGGAELSQGQWQKLAIARAFYERAPILILDEPTSAIDAETEYEIFNNLLKFYKDKTLFLISHRFSTVRNANKIIVLNEGEIVEEGSHEDLLMKDGLYAKMFKKQAIGYQ